MRRSCVAQIVFASVFGLSLQTSCSLPWCRAATTFVCFQRVIAKGLDRSHHYRSHEMFHRCDNGTTATSSRSLGPCPQISD